MHLKPRHEHEELTLRKIVSDGGRLFDPLGIALPVAMGGRILQQACWSVSTGWDEVLNDKMQQRWKRWLKATKKLASFQIPRAVKQIGKDFVKQRLIMFVDASSEAQAAVAYVQTLYSDGTLAALILAAKGKVSALKKQESIPRLECSAAAMGAEFATKIIEVTGLKKEDTLFFTDSATTLWWIKSNKLLKVYVANRVCCVLDHSDAQQWKHVLTNENPADLPTRTLNVKRLKKKPVMDARARIPCSTTEPMARAAKIWTNRRSETRNERLGGKTG